MLNFTGSAVTYGRDRSVLNAIEVQRLFLVCDVCAGWYFPVHLEKSGHSAYNHALVSVLSEPIFMQQSEPVQNAPFWQVKSLQQMTMTEWESLCDGCGKCCLNKLIDEDTEELVFTNVACNLLNTKTCQCSDYGNRFKKEPDCLQITHDKIAEYDWLPSTCAYRLLAEGQSLPEWHPLITGSRSAMHQAGQSVRGKVVHEVDAGDWIDHIITWAS
jgi:hypothetical protein